MSGKPGRPKGDRLARQRQIFDAVAPLISAVGVKSMTMRQAAERAHMSLGGLYHYFPTKDSLVLHALQPEVFERMCEDFHRHWGWLETADPHRYIEAFIAFNVEQTFFVRPSVHAALQLGEDAFREGMEAGLNAGIEEFSRVLRHAAPSAGKEELERVGKALRRALVAAIMDEQITPVDLRADLRAIVRGYLSREPDPALLPMGSRPERAGVAERAV